MDKDNRNCGELTQFLPLNNYTQGKFLVYSQHVLITSIVDKLFLIDTNIRVLYVWFCYFDMAICVFVNG